jgi:hypothetical protein
VGFQWQRTRLPTFEQHSPIGGQRRSFAQLKQTEVEIDALVSTLSTVIVLIVFLVLSTVIVLVVLLVLFTVIVVIALVTVITFVTVIVVVALVTVVIMTSSVTVNQTIVPWATIQQIFALSADQ